MRKITLMLMISLLAVVFSACQAAPTMSPPPPEEPTRPEPTSTRSAPNGSFREGEDSLDREDITALVMEDLSLRYEVEINEIEVLSREEVLWPNPGLGCPEPGISYDQVITPGYLLRLGIQDEVFEYHADERGNFVLCVGGQPAVPVEGEGSGMQDNLVKAAKADLAERLGIEQEEIEVVSVEEVTWRDGSIGCPEPGMAYTQALVNGTRILLEAEGQTYHYHSGRGAAPFLCENPQEPLEGGSSGS